MHASMHIAFRGKQVVHAPNIERHVAILLQRNQHAAIVAMLLQLDSFDFHVSSQAMVVSRRSRLLSAG
jgi:hypothetical protein